MNSPEQSLNFLPFDRYLPPLDNELVQSCLLAIEPGSWLFDPFGASLRLPLLAAQAGCRVLVACNNPLLAFTLETLASAPSADELMSVLAALASSRRGDERLEKQIQSLYQTGCAYCGYNQPAQAFLWQRDAAAPFATLLRCPSCGSEGEQPFTPADLERLNRLGSAPLARALAIERAAPDGPDQRAAAEEAINAYLPRPLSILFTLLNKTESLGLPPERKRLLTALLLSVCDAASSLWPHPLTRTRPRQVSVPAEFRENNLWLALESAASEWSGIAQRVPFTRWPALPPESGGICLFAGRARALLPLPPELKLNNIFTCIPRPNQAFWTFSALWSGWLWGKDAAAPLKSVLSRTHYDWFWHAQALESTLSVLRAQLPETNLTAIAAEINPALLLSSLLAAQSAGYQRESLTLHEEQDSAVFRWLPGKIIKSTSSNPDWKPIISQALQAELSARAEPATYLPLYTAALIALQDAHALPVNLDDLRPDLSFRINNTLEDLLKDPNRFRRYPPRGNESNQWWFSHPGEDLPLPLADRVEVEIVRFLQQNQQCSFQEVEEHLRARFTGLQPVEPALIRSCLNSYADPLPDGAGWQLRPGENPATRRSDLAEAAALLKQIGARLGFTCKGENPLQWLSGSQPVASYHLLASAVISRFMLTPIPENGVPVLVLPGSRSALLAHKLARDPRLAEAARGWKFLKLRHLRRLSENQQLTPVLWSELLDEDQPDDNEPVQMRMF